MDKLLQTGLQGFDWEDKIEHTQFYPVAEGEEAFANMLLKGNGSSGSRLRGEEEVKTERNAEGMAHTGSRGLTDIELAKDRPDWRSWRKVKEARLSTK